MEYLDATKMTLQEVFDEAVKHLMQMKGQSRIGGCEFNACAMRGLDIEGNDTCCVAGKFIPSMVPMYEGNADSPDLKGILGHAQELLTVLQAWVHDSDGNWDGSNFVGFGILRCVADKFNLEYTRGGTS